MNKIYIIVAIVVALPATTIAQTELSSYNMMGEEVAVSYVIEGDTKYDMYLDLNENGTHSLNLKLDELEQVHSFFSSTYAKFKEWSVIAVENDVKDMNREIDTASIGDNLAFIYGDWQFAFGSTDVRAMMRVTEQGQPLYGVVIPERTSSSNRYMKSDTQVLLWENEVAFNSFLKHFDEGHLVSTVDEHVAQGDLFEN